MADDKIKLASGAEVPVNNPGTEDAGKILMVDSNGELDLLTPAAAGLAETDFFTPGDGTPANGDILLRASGKWEPKTLDEANVMSMNTSQTIVGVKAFDASALPTLGANPSESTQAARKAYADSLVASSGGDVSGALSNLTVNTLSGGSSFSSIIQAEAPGGDCSGTISAMSVDKLKGVALGTTTATNGHVLRADGNDWESVSLATAGICPLALKTTLDAVTGVIKSDGAGTYAAAASTDLSNTSNIDLLDASQTISGVKTIQQDVKLQFGDANTSIQKVSADSLLELLTDLGISIESTIGVAVTAPKNYGAVDEIADGVIADKMLCQIDASGDLVVAGVDSVNIAGINCEGAAVAGTDPMILGVKGHMTGVADALIEGGAHLKSCSGGRVGRFITATLAGDTMQVAAAGSAFTNQPANDGIEILSSAAGDTNIAVTIYGTTNGTDTLLKEEMTTDAADGTTFKASTKVDWGLILGVEAGAHAGTITVREASGDLEIVALPSGTNSAGVETITTETRAFNKAPTVVSDGATTKQVGIVGTSTAYAELLDSQALNGTSAVTMNSAFNGATKLLVGDLEAGNACTLAVGAADDYQLCIGKAGPAGAGAKDSDVIVIL